jgi:hypothetical protein
MVMAANAAPSPYPTTSHLRVIVTVRASSFCSAVRSTAVPIGFVVRTNDAAFSSLTANPPSLDPSDPNRFAVANATAKIMYAVVQNLELAENVLHRSWGQYPHGKDANVDALRQRLQNLIDLQRGITNDYYRMGNGDDAEVTDLSADAPVDTAHPVSLRRRRINTGASVIGGMRGGDDDASIDIGHEANPEDLPSVDVRVLARYGGAHRQKRELDLQEYAFAAEIATALKACGMQ